jgi:hypothetical protein
MTDTPASAIIRHPRWPWVVLGLGLLWTVMLRVPLIVNAEDHIDSDLAVDGLTLIDAVHGQWRWHYPGTPHMGILPLFFSYPQSLIFGANAFTLVSGGTLIWLLIVTGTFWLAWKTYGPAVAGWAIIPLVFSSTGTIWLSGRITGGHLLTLACHTLAFVGLHACLTKGGWRRAAALGLWCGLGLYLDMMFLFTLFGLAPALLIGWFFGGRWRLKLGTVAAFVVAAIAGFMPHEAGRLVDPYDAYPSQFAATFDARAIREHGRLLALRCLPRLIAGTELATFDRVAEEAGPRTRGLLRSLTGAGRPSDQPPMQEWFALVFLAEFLVAVASLARDLFSFGDACRKATTFGTVLSALLIVGAFMVNRNIFNSDNYRYLIYLLTPWSLGFGLVMSGLMKRGKSGRVTAFMLLIVMACTVTGTTLRWYRDKLHYIDDEWRVIAVSRPAWSNPGLSEVFGLRGSEGFLNYEIPPDVTHVFGGYWDVYRMSFLSGKRVVGIPYPMYPNRLQGWSRALGPDEGKLLVLGLRIERGVRSWRSLRKPKSTIEELYDPASKANWRSPFETVWRNDGRDTSELNRIRVIIPPANSVGP